MTKLSDKQLFLLDMDGTIYLSETLIDGVADLLQLIHESGKRYLFLTNNSSRSTDAYISKMKRLGIDSTSDDFITSVDATISYLKKAYDDALYYVCGTESFKAQLRLAGLRISDTLSDDVSVLLLGCDTELNYKKLEDCCILLGRNVDYIATHPDMVCPSWYGFAPDCGSIAEMLFTATGRRPKIIGKPQPEMALMALERAGVEQEYACVIGDQIYTDIACGANAGIDTVFVLSGKGVVSDIEKYHVQPTWILESVREVYNIVGEKR